MYNKKTKKLLSMEDKGFSNDIDGGISFFPYRKEHTGEMITWKSAEDFKEEILSKDYAVQKAKYGNKFEHVYQLANSLQEDDNLILIIAK